MRCVVGCRHGSGSLLLWLWCRLAAIAQVQALIQSLACESPYASGAALKIKKKEKKKIRKKKRPSETENKGLCFQISSNQMVPCRNNALMWYFSILGRKSWRDILKTQAFLVPLLRLHRQPPQRSDQLQ